MTLNIQKFNQIVSEAKAKAKAKTQDPKWLRAIEKAAAAILDGSMIVTTLQHGALVTTDGGTYTANGACDCPARTKHCYHRAGARLWHLYETAPEAVTIEAEVAFSSRANLIAEITNIWPRVETTPLAVALMARFGKNQLQMLDDDMLRRVRLAIAI